MKVLLPSIALGAGAAALFALSACQSQESPTESAPIASEGSALPSGESRQLPEGRKATDAEVALILARATDATQEALSEAPAALAKTAKIVGYRPGIGWWVWYPLSAGTRWYWPMGTTVSEIQIFDQNDNGSVMFDNLEIGIQP